MFEIPAVIFEAKVQNWAETVLKTISFYLTQANVVQNEGFWNVWKTRYTGQIRRVSAFNRILTAYIILLIWSGMDAYHPFIDLACYTKGYQPNTRYSTFPGTARSRKILSWNLWTGRGRVLLFFLINWYEAMNN